MALPVLSSRSGLKAQANAPLGPRPALALRRVVAVRSTVLVACAGTLREHGFEEAYRRELPREHHDVLLHACAGTWIPVDVAEVHYATCDRLGVSAELALEFGRAAGRRIQGMILGSLLRVTAAAGGTPWTLFEFARLAYERIYRGGSLNVVPTGPKDVRLEFQGVPFVTSAYYRRALPGVLSSVLEPVCHRFVCRALGPGPAPGSFHFRAQWV